MHWPTEITEGITKGTVGGREAVNDIGMHTLPAPWALDVGLARLALDLLDAGETVDVALMAQHPWVVQDVRTDIASQVLEAVMSTRRLIRNGHVPGVAGVQRTESGTGAHTKDPSSYAPLMPSTSPAVQCTPLNGIVY